MIIRHKLDTFFQTIYRPSYLKDLKNVIFINVAEFHYYGTFHGKQLKLQIHFIPILIFKPLYRWMSQFLVLQFNKIDETTLNANFVKLTKFQYCKTHQPAM